LAAIFSIPPTLIHSNVEIFQVNIGGTKGFENLFTVISFSFRGELFEVKMAE